MDADLIHDLLDEVPRLESSSGYSQFAIAMQECLEQLGYGRLLPGGAHAKAPIKKEGERSDNYLTRRERWEDKQAMACAAIRTRLGCVPKATVVVMPANADGAAKFETVVEIWEELERVYRPNEYPYYRALLSDWEDLQLAQCSNIRDLASRLRDITDNLRHIEEELAKPEPEMIMKFHAALGPEYSDHVTEFECSHNIFPSGKGIKGSKKGVTFDQAVRSAERYEFMLQRPQLAEPARAEECPHCHKNGHTGAECWREHPELRPAHFKARDRRAKRRRLS
jgi:hypothetical protein